MSSFGSGCLHISPLSESHSVVSNSLWPHRLYSQWNSPGQNTGVGSLSLLQGIFLTQESNWDLLHCRQILDQLSYQESRYPLLIHLSLSIHCSLSIHYLPIYQPLTSGSVLKNLPGKEKMQFWFLGKEDALENEMATHCHSSILPWEIPWTEEPRGLQSMGLQRVGHDLVTKELQQQLMCQLACKDIVSNSGWCPWSAWFCPFSHLRLSSKADQLS